LDFRQTFPFYIFSFQVFVLDTVVFRGFEVGVSKGFLGITDSKNTLFKTYIIGDKKSTFISINIRTHIFNFNY